MLIVTAPLLACLPTPSMTDAEMACCKKMAGNCEMGSGNHSCCKTPVSVSQSVTAIAQSHQTHVPPVLVAISTLLANSSTNISSDVILTTPSPIPISPPGLQSILRI
jgi:hypothetical protein